MGIFVREIKQNKFEENTEPLLNPFRGMYCIHKFYVNQEIDVEELKFYDNQRLILVELNLSAYRTGNIDSQALERIRKLFEKYSEKRLGLILRFLYDFDGEGIKNEPESLNIIINHIKQLSVILKEYDDIIFVIQGLFIGSWGEMHSTRFREKYHHIQLYKQLVKSCGSNTYFAVRCPYMWRYISDSENENRLGLFNDAILGSQTDLGTYAEDGVVSAYGKYDRGSEIAFQSKICQFVPNGGEILASELSDDKVNVLQTLKDMKVSYLNSEHDLKVIEKWKEDGASWIASEWKDKSFYDYLSEHIGYRFSISEIKGKYHKLSRKFKYVITIVNEGTAPCYQDIEVMFMFKGKNNAYLIPAGLIGKAFLEDKRRLSGEVKIPGKVFSRQKEVKVAVVLSIKGSDERIVLGNITEISDRANVIGKI